jgi:hypothetical protein
MMIESCAIYSMDGTYVRSRAVASSDGEIFDDCGKQSGRGGSH